MNDNALLEEVYVARKALWDEAGGSLEGLLAFLKEHPLPNVRYVKLPIAKPRRSSLLASHAAIRRSASHHSPSRRKKAEAAK